MVRIDSQFRVSGIFDGIDELIVMVCSVNTTLIEYSWVAFIYQRYSFVCMHIDEMHVYYIPEQIFFAVYCSFLF